MSTCLRVTTYRMGQLIQDATSRTGLAQRVMHVAYSGYVKGSASTRSANLLSRLSAHLEK